MANISIFKNFSLLKPLNFNPFAVHYLPVPDAVVTYIVSPESQTLIAFSLPNIITDDCFQVYRTDQLIFSGFYPVMQLRT